MNIYVIEKNQMAFDLIKYGVSCRLPLGSSATVHEQLRRSTYGKTI